VVDDDALNRPWASSRPDSRFQAVTMGAQCESRRGSLAAWLGRSCRCNPLGGRCSSPRAPARIGTVDQPTAIWIALVGAGGAIVGALVGALGAAIVEHGHRAQEDRFRFAADRRSLYALFLHQSDAIHDAVSGYILALRIHSSDRTAAAQAVPAQDPVAIAYNEIRLIGTDPVVAAAGGLLWNDLDLHRYTMYELGDAAAGFVRPLERWESFEEDWRAARENFLEVARLELAVETIGIASRIRRALHRERPAARKIDNALALTNADRTALDEARALLAKLESAHPERGPEIAAAREELARLSPPTADHVAKVVGHVTAAVASAPQEEVK
jgi:hypothetical protein